MGIDVTSDEPGESMDGADIIGDMDVIAGDMDVIAGGMDVIAGGIIDGIDIIEEEPGAGMPMAIDNIARPSSGSTEIEVLLLFGHGAPARGPVLFSFDRTVVPSSKDRLVWDSRSFCPASGGFTGAHFLAP